MEAFSPPPPAAMDQPEPAAASIVTALPWWVSPRCWPAAAECVNQSVVMIVGIKIRRFVLKLGLCGRHTLLVPFFCLAARKWKSYQPHISAEVRTPVAEVCSGAVQKICRSHPPVKGAGPSCLHCWHGAPVCPHPPLLGSSVLYKKTLAHNQKHLDAGWAATSTCQLLHQSSSLRGHHPPKPKGSHNAAYIHAVACLTWHRHKAPANTSKARMRCQNISTHPPPMRNLPGSTTISCCC